MPGLPGGQDVQHIEPQLSQSGFRQYAVCPVRRVKRAAEHAHTQGFGTLFRLFSGFWNERQTQSLRTRKWV